MISKLNLKTLMLETFFTDWTHTHKHTCLSKPGEMEWPKAAYFFDLICFVFLLCVPVHTKTDFPQRVRVKQPLAATSFVPSLCHHQRELLWGRGSKLQPPQRAAGPSLSGEPSGSWRCGAVDRDEGPKAAGSPCWGLGPWEKTRHEQVRQERQHRCFIDIVRLSSRTKRAQILLRSVFSTIWMQ